MAADCRRMVLVVVGVLLPLLACGVTALRVHEPSRFAGNYPSPIYRSRTGSQSFRLTANLTALSPAEVASLCTGGAPLAAHAGRAVLGGPAPCEAERQAEAARAAGVRALVLMEADGVFVRGVHLSAGHADSYGRLPVVVTLQDSFAAAAAFLRGAAGQRSVVVTLQAGEQHPWAAVYGSTAVLLLLQAVGGGWSFALFLAASHKLYAYGVRPPTCESSAGGCCTLRARKRLGGKAAVARWVLAIEAGGNLLRTVAFGVDPFYIHGVLPLPLQSYIAGLCITFGTVTTALVMFAWAAANRMRRSNPLQRYRRQIAAVILLQLLLDTMLSTIRMLYINANALAITAGVVFIVTQLALGIGFIASGARILSSLRGRTAAGSAKATTPTIALKRKMKRLKQKLIVSSHSGSSTVAVSGPPASTTTAAAAAAAGSSGGGTAAAGDTSATPPVSSLVDGSSGGGGGSSSKVRPLTHAMRSVPPSGGSCPTIVTVHHPTGRSAASATVAPLHSRDATVSAPVLTTAGLAARLARRTFSEDEDIVVAAHSSGSGSGSGSGSTSAAIGRLTHADSIAELKSTPSPSPPPPPPSPPPSQAKKTARTAARPPPIAVAGPRSRPREMGRHGSGGTTASSTMTSSTRSLLTPTTIATTPSPARKRSFVERLGESIRDAAVRVRGSSGGSSSDVGSGRGSEKFGDDALGNDSTDEEDRAAAAMQLARAKRKAAVLHRMTVQFAISGVAQVGSVVTFGGLWFSRFHPTAYMAFATLLVYTLLLTSTCQIAGFSPPRTTTTAGAYRTVAPSRVGGSRVGSRAASRRVAVE